MNRNSGSSPALFVGTWLRRGLAALEAALVIAVVAAGGLWVRVADEPQPDSNQLAPQLHATVSRGDLGANSHWMIYIAGSDDEAVGVRLAIDAGSEIRHQLGLDLAREDVLVASSSEDANAMVRMLAEGNPILVALGRTEPHIVNLLI